MAKFKVGDKVKTTGKLSGDTTVSIRGGLLGTIVGFDTDGKYKVKMDNEVKPWYLAEHEITLANSISTNSKFKVGDWVVYKDGYFGRWKVIQTKVQGISDKIRLQNYDGKTEDTYEECVKAANSISTNSKFKVGDAVEVIGQGLATKGNVGRIMKVDLTKKGWPYIVSFGNGVSDGEYAEEELRKAYNSLSTNSVVANAMAARVARNSQGDVISETASSLKEASEYLEEAKNDVRRFFSYKLRIDASDDLKKKSEKLNSDAKVVYGMIAKASADVAILTREANKLRDIADKSYF